MIYIGNNEYPIYLGNSEIPAIYCGEELIYPVNLGTLTGITIEDLEWNDDIPYTGGTADYTGCSFKVVAEYDSGKSRTVTSKATVTSNSITVQENTGTTRENIGQITVTATFEGFSASATVDAYQAPGYYYQYLTFRITSPGTINWCARNSSHTKTISYSIDGGVTWTSITSTTSTGTKITVSAGDVVMFKGENATYTEANTTSYSNSFSGTTASMTIEGNIMSLIYGDNFVGNDVLTSTFNFFMLFYKISGVTDVSNLVLPATTLTRACYRSLFEGISITEAPKLPATTLAAECYSNLFLNCKNLVKAPDLLAGTLVYGGSSNTGCYNNMFYGCTSLKYIKCLARSYSNTYFGSWVNNVPSVGTFVKYPGVNWANGASGIPNGWTIIESTE